MNPSAYQNRLKLLESCIAEVALHGIDGTTVQMIARHAGVSTGLYASHFEDKDDMMAQALTLLATQEKHTKADQDAFMHFVAASSYTPLYRKIIGRMPPNVVSNIALKAMTRLAAKA